jgi:hypothetical protein
VLRKLHTPPPCRVYGCVRPSYPTRTQCHWHVQRSNRAGTAKGISLTPAQRKPYLSSSLSVLRSRSLHARRRDPAVMGLLDALSGLLHHRLERQHQLNGWYALHPKQSYGEHAALVVASNIVGVLVCLKTEPGVMQDPTYARFQVMRSLAHLLPRRKAICITTERNGIFNTLKMKAYRPHPTGKLIVGYLHAMVVDDVKRFLSENPQIEKAVLEHLLKHPNPQRPIRLFKSIRKPTP